MALEDLTGTKYINSLVATNPAAGDNVSEGDDHIRGIKNTIKNTFPNVDGAVNTTEDELNLLDGSVSNTVVNSKAVVYGSAGEVQATTVDLGNWTVTESAGVLYFATGGTNKMKLDASGNLTCTGDVTAFGTV